MLAMACAKHYAVHSGPESDRHRFDAKVSDRDLFETYLPQFERVVREGKVAGVMGAYNCGRWRALLAPIHSCSPTCCARNGDSTAMSFRIAMPSATSGASSNISYVNTPEEAAAAAIKAGCNLCCGGDYNALVRAVQQGLVTEKEIDDALYPHLVDPFPTRPV